MTPIERAKAAIANELGVSSAPIESFALSDGRLIATETIIRAVLTAIREPSEAMLCAGKESAWVGADLNDGHPCIVQVWPAMIDAMLEEGPPA